MGLLSLLFEVLLRESFGKDLLRFLNLRSAIVRSGLQHISSESEYDWASVLDSAVITVVVRNPAEWLIPSVPAVISACEKRTTTVRILVPDVNGPNFAALAESTGLEGDDLERNIETAVQTAQTQWNTKQPHLHAGSTLEFVAYQDLALHDLVRADNQTVVLLPRGVDPVGVVASGRWD